MIRARLTIKPPACQPAPAQPTYQPDPVGQRGNIDRVAEELLTLLKHADGRYDSAERRELLGDLLAAIEDRRGHWVD